MRDVDDLAELLTEAVANGAGLGYHTAPPHEEAARAWRSWLREASAVRRVVLVARQANRIVGTVQVDFARAQNAAHRAEGVKRSIGDLPHPLGAGLMRNHASPTAAM